MTNEEVKKIAFRVIARVETGFSFIEDNYLIPQRKNSGPDTAWLRSVYILFSFHFELLLKSALILFCSFSSKKELERKLLKVGHNLNVIIKELGDEGAAYIGIKSVSVANGEYEVIALNGKILVKDFIDIRYDFIEGRVRDIYSDEDLIISQSINLSRDVLNKIKQRYSLL